MKKRKNSRQKGATYERDIAKILSKWCGIKLKRTPMSGGWAKTGDITPVDPEEMVDFPFNIELKNRQGWDFKELIKGTNKRGIVDWWEQAVRDAKTSNRFPILIFTRVRDVNYCMVPSKFFKTVIGKNINSILWNGKRIFLLDDLLKVKYSAAKTYVAELWEEE